jgi:hypothetical protein
LPQKPAVVGGMNIERPTSNIQHRRRKGTQEWGARWKLIIHRELCFLSGHGKRNRGVGVLPKAGETPQSKRWREIREP